MRPEQAQVRPMAAADLDRVIEIAAGLASAPQWPRTAYIDALNPDAAPPRIALVAAGAQIAPAHGGQFSTELVPCDVQGFAVASLLPPQAELEVVAVAAEHQRRGLGRQLLAALTAQLSTEGISELLLEVRASNRPAIAFYREFGFIESGLRQRYYVDPIEDAALMRLLLG